MRPGRAAVYTIRTVGLALIWLAAAALIKPVQDRVESRLSADVTISDQLFFTSPQVVRKLSLGHESLLADIYWMRAIQYYGRRDEADRRPVRYKNLALLLDTATTLDPDMIEAYRTGSTFLAEKDPVGAGQPAEAIRLLDKGIASHPQEWQLQLDKGFVYFWYLQDYRSAGETWLAASRLASAPPWMEGLAAMSLSKGGAVEAAKALWLRQYQESPRADIKENARNHLLSIQVSEDLWTLEFLIERFRERHGTFPATLQDLPQEAPLRFAASDPLGTPYLYDRGTGKVDLSAQTQVRYLAVPADYRDAFMERLTRSLSSFLR
jgi:tetratricopeptide (TPR) repeat protein